MLLRMDLKIISKKHEETYKHGKIQGQVKLNRLHQFIKRNKNFASRGVLMLCDIAQTL